MEVTTFLYLKIDYRPIWSLLQYFLNVVTDECATSDKVLCYGSSHWNKYTENERETKLDTYLNVFLSIYCQKLILKGFLAGLITGLLIIPDTC